MSAAIPIYKGQDFFVPTFQLKVKNRDLASDVVRDVLQVTYKDSLTAIDSFELSVNNWDAKTRTFKYSDQDTFDPGSEISLSMGYHSANGTRTMLSGEVTSLRPTFPSSGQPTLAVSGLNLLHRFRKKQVSKTYEKKKDSQIAKEIGTRLGVKVETDANAERKETIHEFLFQDELDIVFLFRRARKNGYDLTIREGKTPTLFFGPSGSQKKVTYKLAYGKSLIEFQPNLTTANQVNEVIVRGWDSKAKKKIEGKAQRSQLKEAPIAGQVDKSFQQRSEVIADQPVHSENEAKRLALETLRNISKDMITATGKTIGLPDLRAGGLIEIQGVGERFSGNYFVTSTTHTLSDSGYLTAFECRREEG